MATQQIQTRKQRGDRIAPEDIVELNSQSYFVKSQTGRSGYSVTKAGEGWACDCPDFRFRGLPCKHIFAVENAISESTLQSKFKLGLWEAPQ
jgi:predicted nucleic acid-binding Zn finger protein